MSELVNKPDRAGDSLSHWERVALFLFNACPDHHVRGPNAHVLALHAAERILRRHPEIARDSIYTAVVCGDLDEVERALSERPELASEKGGPKGWEPLLYLCFTRLPMAAANNNALAIARALLDRGADPAVYFMAGDSRYTPLTGVIGEGEEDRPGHPQREGLTRLLLERGADPFDMQVFYNIHFHGEIIWFLDMIYDHTVKIGRQSEWDDPEWSMIDEGGYGKGARYLLTVAVSNNNLQLAEWILTHGASPNPAPPPHPKLPKDSLHELALRNGFTEMADLLVRFGMTPSTFVRDEVEEFHAACLQLDHTRVKVLLKQHPEYLHAPGGMHYAAKRDLVEVVEFLLGLGMSPEIEDPREGNQRPLHVAAYADSFRVATLLIERGAEIDPVETNWNNTPLNFAVYGHKPRMIELLGRYSKAMFCLTVTGNVERLREVLRDEPGLAKFTEDGNYTLLMWLPDDEARALEIIELLIAYGADPAFRSPEGKTAADYASRRGLEEAAELLRAKASAGAT